MSPHICRVPVSKSTQASQTNHTVTGAVTVTTLPSSISSSLALWHNSRTCASGIGLQARSCAIALEAVLARAVPEWDFEVVLVQVAHLEPSYSQRPTRLQVLAGRRIVPLSKSRSSAFRFRFLEGTVAKWSGVGVVKVRGRGVGPRRSEELQRLEDR